MRTALWSLLAALAANALFAWWGRSTFVPLGLVVTGAVLLSVLLGVLAAVIRAFSKGAANDATRLTLRILLISIVFFSSTAAGLPLVRLLIERDVRRARSVVEELAARLSMRYAMSSTYPEDLSPLLGARRLPVPLQRPDAYRSTGTSYVFRIRIPGHPTAGEVFSSTDHIWRAE